MDVPTLSPMRALDASVPPFTDPEWLYEIKFDGYRTLAYVDRGRVALRTKNGADCTAWFPEVAGALATQFSDASGLIIDLIRQLAITPFFEEQGEQRRSGAGT